MFLIRESLRLVWNFDELDAFKLSNPVYMGILGDPEPTFDTRPLNWGVRILPLVLSTDSDATPGAGSWAKIHPATQADRGSYMGVS